VQGAEFEQDKEARRVDLVTTNGHADEHGHGYGDAHGHDEEHEIVGGGREIDTLHVAGMHDQP